MRAFVALVVVGHLLQCISAGKSCGKAPPGDGTIYALNKDKLYKAPSKAKYKCIDGYKVEGKANGVVIAKVECVQKTYRAKWDTSPPKCEPVECPKPPELVNTVVEENDHVLVYIFGDIYKYKCTAGYIQAANLTMTCLANGHWSQLSPPICSAVTCSNPPEGVNTEPVDSKAPYNYGDKYIYICTSGYSCASDMTATCMNNGIWSHPPTCSAQSCSSGWVRNPVTSTCLYFAHAQVEWYKAKQMCEHIGSKLAQFDSYEAMAWFMSYRQKTRGTYSVEFWLSAKYDHNSRKYTWANGSGEQLQIDARWWYRGYYDEPNRTGDCVNSYGAAKDFQLRDKHCSGYCASYVCER